MKTRIHSLNEFIDELTLNEQTIENRLPCTKISNIKDLKLDGLFKTLKSKYPDAEFDLTVPKAQWDNTNDCSKWIFAIMLAGAVSGKKKKETVQVIDGMLDILENHFTKEIKAYIWAQSDFFRSADDDYYRLGTSVSGTPIFSKNGKSPDWNIKILVK